MTWSLTGRHHKHDDQSPGSLLQRGGPQYQREGTSISESKISKEASLSLAQHCDRRHQLTARHLGHCCHYDDDDFGHDDNDHDEYIRTEEEEESKRFTYLL